jgi:hypothetical protein
MDPDHAMKQCREAIISTTSSLYFSHLFSEPRHVSFSACFSHRRPVNRIMNTHFATHVSRARSVMPWILLVAVMAFMAAVLVGCGGGGSTTVVAPTITTQPTTQTVATGASASFSVTATGTNLKYQWYKGGSTISGATSSTYTIASATATDAGSYYVIVSNSTSTVTSSTVILTVSSSTGNSTVTVG